MTTRKQRLQKMVRWFVVSALGLCILGFLIAELKAENVGEGLPGGVKKEVMGQAAEKAKEMVTKSVGDYVKNFKSNLSNMDKAMNSLDTVKKYIDMGDTKTASAEIENTKSLLMPVRESLNEYVKQNMVVNSRCPITGLTIIDPVNIPANRTRMYKEKMIGFCTAACPAKWDALSDEEKDKKLEEAIETPAEEQTEKETPAGDMETEYQEEN